MSAEVVDVGNGLEHFIPHTEELRKIGQRLLVLGDVLTPMGAWDSIIHSPTGWSTTRFLGQCIAVGEMWRQGKQIDNPDCMKTAKQVSGGVALLNMFKTHPAPQVEAARIAKGMAHSIWRDLHLLEDSDAPVPPITAKQLQALS